MNFGKKNKFGQNINTDQNKQITESVFANTKRVHKIDVNQIIQNPYQPRMEQTDLSELKASIENIGLIQPITVIKNNNNTFTLVCGHRRLEAIKELKYDSVEAIIVENDENLQLKALAENAQRKDLSPLELAFVYKDIIDTKQYTYDELAKHISKSKAHISQILSILKLDDKVLKAIKDDKYTNLLVLHKLNQIVKSFQYEIYQEIKDMTRDDAIKYINKQNQRPTQEAKSPMVINKKRNKYTIEIEINKLNTEQRKEAVSELYKIIKIIKNEKE